LSLFKKANKIKGSYFRFMRSG